MISSAFSAETILALNCAEECMQVVVGTAQAVLFAEELRCPGQSIRHLHPTIEQALRLCDLTIRDLSGLICVRGPGSFTGLRISHAAMYGLARSGSVPMASLEYHGLLAAQAAQILEANGAEIWVLTYARKNQVYAQGFAQGMALTPIQAMTALQARAMLAGKPASTAILGSGVRLNEALAGLPLHILPRTLDTPDALFFLQAAAQATYSADPPAPLYVRKSDAEANLETIAHARGITDQAARQHIFDFA